MDLPPEMIALLATFTLLFSDRVWTKAHVLAIGALLATGHRTVCSALRVMGLSHERHFTNYHRVLNRDAWSCLAAGQILLGLIGAVLPRDWPMVLAADDTIERRCGRRIKAKVCQARADVLGLPAAGPWPDLAGANQRHVGGKADVIELPRCSFEAFVQGLSATA